MLLKTKKPDNSALASIKKQMVPSILSRNLNVLGNIDSDGAIDFAGNLNGNVRCHSLTVRVDGSVTGEIFAESAFIYGKVKGIIHARDVHLFASCHIEGIIMHESLSIEDGAFIDGSCKRTDKTMEGSLCEAPKDSATSDLLENLRLISA